MLPVSNLKTAFVNAVDSFTTLRELQRLIDLVPLEANYSSLTEKEFLDICILIVSYQRLSRIEIARLQADFENLSQFVFRKDEVVVD